jgi:hypothetical protein
LTHVSERLRRLRPPEVVAAAAIVIASVHTIGLVRFALGHSTFPPRGDDVEGFWMSKNLPFWKYLFTPVDVHQVPLYRLVSYVFVRLASLNFSAAQAVLLAFHLLGCFFLFATLDRIRRTPWNTVLVAYYAMNVYLASQLLWWTSGLIRLPCVLFSSMATFFYLKYRRDRARLSFVLVILSIALALGFFAKGVLIAAELVVLELVLRWSDGGTLHGSETNVNRPSVWTLLAAALAMSIGYVVLWRAATPPSFRQANVDLQFLFLYLKWSWMVFGLGTAGYLFEDGPSAGLWVGLAWAAVLAYSIVRRRATLVAWASVLVLVSLSVYTGTSQTRERLMGAFTALLADRYYFELMPILVLFAAIALAEVRPTPAETAFQRRPLASWAGAALVVAGLCFLSVNSSRSVERLFATRYCGVPNARLFLTNLRHDLKLVARDPDGTWPLVDRNIQGDRLMATHPKNNSELLELMGERPRSVAAAPGAYWITDSGHIFRL